MIFHTLYHANLYHFNLSTSTSFSSGNAKSGKSSTQDGRNITKYFGSKVCCKDMRD